MGRELLCRIKNTLSLYIVSFYRYDVRRRIVRQHDCKCAVSPKKENLTDAKLAKQRHTRVNWHFGDTLRFLLRARGRFAPAPAKLAITFLYTPSSFLHIGVSLFLKLKQSLRRSCQRARPNESLANCHLNANPRGFVPKYRLASASCQSLTFPCPTICNCLFRSERHSELAAKIKVIRIQKTAINISINGTLQYGHCFSVCIPSFEDACTVIRVTARYQRAFKTSNNLLLQIFIRILASTKPRGIAAEVMIRKAFVGTCMLAAPAERLFELHDSR